MKVSTVNIMGAYPTVRVSRTWGRNDTSVVISDSGTVVQVELPPDAVNNLVKKLQWAKKMIKEGN